jgi:hypothetical protein
MSTFLKKGEIQLINGGYLSDSKGNPVSNTQFYEAQLQAEYVITFAEFAKGKDFKGKKADSLADLTKEVREFLYLTKPVSYVEKPKEVKRPVTDSLAKEALSFIEFQEKSNIAQKVNNYMQRFNVLHDFEEFGLFFDQQIVKLNKIYTVEEIKTAVNSVIGLLD